MTERSIALSEIRLDGGTQCRAALDTDYITALTEAWSENVKMPAVVMFHDGSSYWLADGFHRYHAAQKCGFRDILAEIRSGTRLDAIKFALGANADHGLRRTNADKRRAVEIALKEFPKLSDREIGRICAVNHEMVGKSRPQLAVSASSEPRIGADGKTRRLPAHKPARPLNHKPAAAAPAREFTVRDLGCGVLVKEPASKSEAYVAENGTVRRMSATEEDEHYNATGDDVPSADEIRSIGNDQPPPMTNCEQWALMAKLHLAKITSQPRGNPDRAAALKDIRAWLDENE